MENSTGGKGSSYNTGSQAPAVTVVPYMDAWAQPDSEDLQGTPNQAVPPGLNLQRKSRHQIFTMNANASDNILQSALTGNAIRNQIFVHRNGGSVRSEGVTDPILRESRNRALGEQFLDDNRSAGGRAPGRTRTADCDNGD